MAPLVKTGGLGDVLGALPKALAELGHEVIVCIPNYEKHLNPDVVLHTIDINGKVEVEGKAKTKTYSVLEAIISDKSFKTLLIGNDKLFGRSGLYVDPKTGKDFDDNDLRFSFFTKAAIDLVQKINWRPDIIHAHDWQAALVPIYLRTVERDNQFFAKTKLVLTIHNMAYQGKFKTNRYRQFGLPEELIYATAPLEFYGEINFLKGGICFADKITTVSKTYAVEIQGELGCGLEGVLRGRSKDIVGIGNGVDYSVWSPAKDKLLPFQYRETNLTGKSKNRAALLKRTGLPNRKGMPLFGMVSRLVEQKGLGLIIEAAEQLFSLNLQLIILGTGDKKTELALKSLEKKHADKLKVYLEFDEKLAHLIEAGSDIYLMPSLFEPCGLNQMYALKYGTPPVVHKVGGLADTIIDYNEKAEEGTGFVFDDFKSGAMMQSIERAIKLFGKKRKWTKLMKNGMKQDFSWDKSAQKYSELFEAMVKT